MKKVTEHLEKLKGTPRKKHHSLIDEIHTEHRISKKTLFYIKEYGPKSNVPRTIIRESVLILLLASAVSSLGGFALERIKVTFISLMPLVVLLPALNDMIGDYGVIVSSRVSTMLHQGKMRKNWWLDKELRKLFLQILIIALITTVLSVLVAFFASKFSGYSTSIYTTLKIFFIAILDVLIIVNILFFTSLKAGWYLYKKEEDPNNFLIPITTSIADFGNMVLLWVLVRLLF